MADQKPLKLPGSIDPANDDPFAELTRIMGFDPRQQPRPAPPREFSAPRPASAADAGEKDFGIDLERELMGALEVAETPAPRPAEQPADHQAAAEHEDDIVFEDDWFHKDEIAADAPAAVPQPANSAGQSDHAHLRVVASAPAAEVPAAEPEPVAAEAPADAAGAFEPQLDIDQIFNQALTADTAELRRQAAAQREAAAAAEPVAAFEPAIPELERPVAASAFEPAPVIEAPWTDAAFAPAVAAQPVPTEDDPEPQLYEQPYAQEAVSVAPEPQPPVEAVAAPEPEPQRPSIEEELTALLGSTLAGAASSHRDFASAPIHEAVADEASDAAGLEPVAAARTIMPWERAVQERGAAASAGAGTAAEDLRDEPGEAAPPMIDQADGAVPAPQQVEHPVSNDAYAAYAATGDDYPHPSTWQRDPVLSQSRYPEDEEHGFVRDYPAAPAAGSGMPEIDTVDVPEQAIALADDLDLPDFSYEEEPAQAPSYDDIDAEFTSLLNEMNASEAEEASAQRGRFDDFEEDYAPLVPGRGDAAAGAGLGAAAAMHLRAPPLAPSALAPAYDERSARRDFAAPDEADEMQPASDMEFAYDPDLDEDIAPAAYRPVAAARAPRRGMMIAGLLCGVAAIGGLGVLALSWGHGIGSSEPVLVKADSSPLKVKPENPGGTVIPNQDNRVYDSVGGAKPAGEPVQDKLVNGAEEPVAMPDVAPLPANAPDEGDDDADAAADPAAQDAASAATAAAPNAAPAAPAPKGEDRLQQTADDVGVDKSVEVAAVAPRKVRTMVVKSDGTLMVRDDGGDAGQAAASGSKSLTAAAPATVAPAAKDASNIVPAADDMPKADAAPADGSEDVAAAPVPAQSSPKATSNAAAKPVAAPAAEASDAGQQAAQTPTRAPIAPERPSDQPVNIIGSVKPQQVASAADAAATTAPAATAVASGSWAMQIASQPTEAAAQSSYQDLLRRYGNVLNGHSTSIVKADIAGKGTFWRVRVSAGSRNDAVALCESYKAAGGNCFVSK